MTALDALLDSQDGVATTGQLIDILGRRRLETRIQAGDLEKVWTGIYGRPEIDDLTRLRGLDLRAGQRVPICLATAARAYGFDTEEDVDLHVLNPPYGQLRRADGLVIHRRDGAPLRLVEGRLATTPGWTAVEVARSLRRPRALATLDAALRSGTCNRQDLHMAAVEQHGRRGIVAVRELIPLADGAAESPMESEARLVMHDNGLPAPELQFEIVDLDGVTWRVDFAWPETKLAVEYEGFDYHSSPADLRHDRRKRNALSQVGWHVLGIVADDVRKRPYETTRDIRFDLSSRRAA
jgi:hypothetical protein